MKSLISIVAATAVMADLVLGQDAYICDQPSTGCRFGIFSQEKCACECILPFCPDASGQCTATGGCANPWEDCERGVNCPWWVNSANAQSCTTGPVVPPGLWDIFNSEETCCKASFPYAETCHVEPGTESPTKYPTIVAPEDNYEIVSIRFDIMGLPGNVALGELTQELKTVMTRIILRLAESIQGLKITKVEERAGGITDNSEGGKRVYYNIYAVRDENKKFAPLLIQAIRDSHDEMVEQIHTFTDTKYFTEDVTINICAMQNGKYDACANDDPTPPPSSSQVVPPPLMALVPESDPDEGGLAGWAISLIVIFVLLFVCCIGYAIAVFCFGVANCFDECFRDLDDTKEIHNNNMYFDDRSRDSRRSRKMLAIEDGSRASGYTSRRSGHSRAIVMATPEEEDESFRFPDDTFTVDASKCTRGTKSTYGTKHRQGRDPTMYIPGQEDKRDPDSESGWFSDGDGSRRYHEDPPLKPKREPTMYFDGHREVDMYSFDDSTVEEVDNEYRGVAKRYEKATRDPTFYESSGNDSTFHVDDAERDEASHSMKSARSKKSTRSKTSTKGKSGDMQKSSQSTDWDASNGENLMYEPAKRASLRASLVSNFYDSDIKNDHANSYTDGQGTRDNATDTRQTKSFYR